MLNCQYNRHMNFYTCVEIRGNKILYRGVEDGSRVCREIPYRPTLYSYTHKSSDWKTLDGRAVEPIKPGTIAETRDFLDQYANISGFSIFGQTDFIYQFIGEEFPNDIDYKIDQIVTAFIDIETKCEAGFPNIETANEQVIAITVRIKNKSYVYGLGTFHIDNPNVSCHQYDNENQMLKDFIEFWEQQKPDIVTGWNVRFFDIPYLYNRISYLFGEDTANRLSPWKKIIKKKIETKSSRGEQTACDIIGVSTLDYYELYKKFTYTNQESYRLDYIASVELGEKKLSYDEYDSLREFYKQDFNKFIHYNFHDVELVFKLDQKMKLIELVLAVAYSAKVNHEDVYSQVRTWDTIIYHELSKKNIVIPPKKEAIKEAQYAGAYVKDPIVGMHEWVVSFDLNSLYPHLIMQYNISPETKADCGSLFGRGVVNPDMILDDTSDAQKFTGLAKTEDVSLAANGVAFTKKYQGFLPKLMEQMYEERSLYKKKMIEAQKTLEKLDPDAPQSVKEELEFLIAKYNNFQMARKIQLNSAYGAIGNEYFRYYDEANAEAITISGQLSIRWIQGKINVLLNGMLKTDDDYVIASDTDSVYVNMGPIVDKFCEGKTKEQTVDFLDKSCKELVEPFIKKCYEELATKMNAYGNKMSMKRESIASKGIWTAKKRYVLLVHDSEGVRYAKPKIKIMGIETTRSSTPQVVRDELKKCIEIIMLLDNNTLLNYIDDFRKRFKKLPAEDVAFPRSVNGMKDYMDSLNIYKKGTPIAVKGALIYNHYIKKHKLEKKYQLIRDADKIKFVYLKTPNPIAGCFGKDQIISFYSSLPKELDLSSYIDYDTQFEKAFLDPLKSIIEAIGWKTENRNTLESLFT